MSHAIIDHRDIHRPTVADTTAARMPPLEATGGRDEAITIPPTDSDPSRPPLIGRCWLPARTAEVAGVVIVNPATGVAARFYHAYAGFLAEHGLRVITYDYDGIGESRRARPRDSRVTWRDWGERDFDAVVGWARRRFPDHPLMVVGHSFGGFLPGFAAGATEVERILTVGAQYAYWRDYAPDRRLGLLLKWHVAMPAITAALGHLPGRRLGWLEDLPAGVAYEWAFRGARMEASHPPADRPGILARFAAVRAPILAVGVTDDEYGTLDALDRALGYYEGAPRSRVMLSPIELGFDAVGHFDLFRSRHRDGFWTATLSWLRDGVNPWPWAAFRPAGVRSGVPA